jgi:hypothetical protein
MGVREPEKRIPGEMDARDAEKGASQENEPSGKQKSEHPGKMRV